MLDAHGFLLFLAAALLLAITPGPGIFYVAARTLAGGRNTGLASSFGTAVGGSVHVVGGAVGISALVMASAEAFAALKMVGAAYLVWLGWKTIREARVELRIHAATAGARRAFRDGIIVEALNPKTAAFFLAFIPQFVDSSQNLAEQFIFLGLISVVLNTAADIVVTCWAAKARSSFESRPWVIQAGSAIFRYRHVRTGRIVAFRPSFELISEPGRNLQIWLGKASLSSCFASLAMYCGEPPHPLYVGSHAASEGKQGDGREDFHRR